MALILLHSSPDITSPTSLSLLHHHFCSLIFTPSLHLSSHQGTAKVQQIFTLGGKQKGMGTVAGVMVQSGYMKAGGGSSSGTYKGVDYLYRYTYTPVSLLTKLCFDM
jgi:hypothetical protein